MQAEIEEDFDLTRFILGDALDADELAGLNQLGFDAAGEIIEEPATKVAIGKPINDPNCSS